MRRESSNAEPGEREAEDKEHRKEALHVLLEARERLLAQMTEDVISNREVLLDGSSGDGYSSFELEEIEDRYSARLNALNALLENLEYRHPRVKYHVETVNTTARLLKKDLGALLEKLDQWDLVDMEVTRLDGGEILVTVALTADEYPE